MRMEQPFYEIKETEVAGIHRAFLWTDQDRTELVAVAEGERPWLEAWLRDSHPTARGHRALSWLPRSW